ncbi:hypothetical protein EYB25_000558 [Talaromyces marneffei]|nr:hypothetical protein EYB25_000558 [Talaromyces marneffei]
MADDGMLLNFSISDTVLKPEAKLKGGSWRDRLSAKKLAQGKRAPRTRVLRTPGTGQSGDNPNNVRVGERRAPSSHPNKRPRTDGADFRPATSSDGKPRGGGASGGHRGPKPKQIISSLFSYNPESKESEEDANKKAEDQADDVEVKPSNAPLIDGIEDFTNLGLAPTLAAHLLTKMELKAPTAIQKASIPQLVKEDSDAFIQAQTGSGKTLAYLLPLVQRIINLKDSGAISKNSGKGNEDSIHRDAGLFAIILAPTRELCKQISIVLENLLRCAHWIVAGTVIGGEKKKSEKARLRKGLNILVATPGRLVDHLDNTQVLDFDYWSTDEKNHRALLCYIEDECAAIGRD